MLCFNPTQVFSVITNDYAAELGKMCQSSIGPGFAPPSSALGNKILDL